MESKKNLLKIPEKQSKEIKQTAQIENLDDLIWYYIDRKDENKVKGTISKRDLEILWKTSAIDSKTFVWKKGMIDWKSVMDVEDLKNIIMDNAKDMQMIQQDILNLKNESENKKKEKNKTDSSLDVAVDSLLTLIAGGELSDDDGTKKRKKSKEIDTSSMTADQIKKMQKNKKKAQKAAEKRKQKWYQTKINTNIYVTGLPIDIEVDEVKDFFVKAGIIRIDVKTSKEKIKLYKDESGNLKGDACISYSMEESVGLALEMLNEREIRPGFKIEISQAEFKQKGDSYIKREEVKVDKVTQEKLKAKIEQQQSWDEQQKGEGLKIVILKGVFSLEEALKEENFFQELQEDIQYECEQKLGPITRIKVYENNPLGVVEIKFKESLAAEACIKLMNGRFFGGKQIQCDYYDGVTDYKANNETKEEEQARIDDFGAWLENGDE